MTLGPDDWRTLPTRVQISDILDDTQDLAKRLRLLKEAFQEREEAQTQALTEAQTQAQAAQVQITELQTKLLQAEHDQAAALAAAQAEIARLKAQVQQLENQLAAALAQPNPNLYPAELPAAQREAGQAALLSAFRQRTDLEALCFHAFAGTRLSDIAADTLELPAVVFQLFDWAEAHGKLPQLLAGARERNPDNPKLKAWLAALAQAQINSPTPPG